MDENENQGSVVVENASIPSEAGMTATEIAEKPFDEVRTKLRKTRAEKRAARGDAAQQEEDASAHPGGERPQYAGNSNDEQPEQTRLRQQEQPKQPEAKPEAKPEEQLAEAKRQASEAQQRLQQYEAEQTRKQHEAQVQAKQEEYRNVVGYIQQNAEWSPEQKQVVLNAYNQSLLTEELNRYGQHVQTLEQTYSEREQELNRTQMRLKLPGYVDSIVDFVGQTVDVPTDSLRGVTQTTEFKNLLDQYQSPRDLAMIGEMMHVFGVYERQRMAEQNEANRLAESGQYVEQRIPSRVTNSAGAGGGKSTVQRIEDVSSQDWPTYVKLLKQHGTPARALAAMKEKK